MKKTVEQLVALGVPGLVLLVAMSMTGFAGAAALTTALAALGGPIGMMGGIALLGLLVLVSKALTEYGLNELVKAVVLGLKKNGMTKKEVIETIEGYPIPAFLEEELKDLVNKYWKSKR